MELIGWFLGGVVLYFVGDYAYEKITGKKDDDDDDFDDLAF